LSPLLRPTSTGNRRPPRQRRPPRPAPLPAKPLDNREVLTGCGVALLLVATAIVDMAVTTGAGAPKHPSSTLATVGLAIVALFAIMLFQRRRRVAVPVALLAVFCEIEGNVPRSVQYEHYAPLGLTAAWALIVYMRDNRMTRQQRAEVAQARREGRPADIGVSPAAASRAPAKGRAGRGEPTGPTKNSRYTPPKPKRPTPTKVAPRAVDADDSPRPSRFRRSARSTQE
jgi:hypothetical protein